MTAHADLLAAIGQALDIPVSALGHERAEARLSTDRISLVRCWLRALHETDGMDDERALAHAAEDIRREVAAMPVTYPVHEAAAVAS